MRVLIQDLLPALLKVRRERYVEGASERPVAGSVAGAVAGSVAGILTYADVC